MKKFSKMHSNKGFTLVELLVIMVIIGVLAAITIPLFLSQTSKNDLSEEMDRALITLEENKKDNRFSKELPEDYQINGNYIINVFTSDDRKIVCLEGYKSNSNKTFTTSSDDRFFREGHCIN